jgi:hypothetical protein
MFKVKSRIKVKEIPDSPAKMVTITKRTKNDKIFEKAAFTQHKVVVPLGRAR